MFYERIGVFFAFWLWNRRRGVQNSEKTQFPPRVFCFLPLWKFFQDFSLLFSKPEISKIELARIFSPKCRKIETREKIFGGKIIENWSLERFLIQNFWRNPSFLRTRKFQELVKVQKEMFFGKALENSAFWQLYL